ncbi:hypothetical protein Scep_015361 [Stephania cephalantha]|uniref:Uncharacterized protein n=1 Tax=Stephania cephalantha TaxID=152367 RepID=A0AAP0J3V0_9MAGN
MESHEEKKKTNGDLGFPFQFFQNFKFPHLEFPQLKKVEVGEVGDGVASKANESDVGVGGGDGDGKGTSLVRFPVPDGAKTEYPSLKWESEEVQGGNLWQAAVMEHVGYRVNYSEIATELLDSFSWVVIYDVAVAASLDCLVYALGGFMIVRWLWGRWKESRANNSDKPQSGSAAGDQPTNAES